MPDQTLFFQNAIAVFQGGGCRVAAFIGAYEEAARRGVHISEVAGTSGGSIIAALIGAGASPEFIRKEISTLDYSQLTNRLPSPRKARRANAALRVAKYFGVLPSSVPDWIVDAYMNGGVYRSDYVADFTRVALRTLLGVSNPQFKDLIMPTYVVAADMSQREPKTWSKESTPEEYVAEAVQASCSIPFYFPPALDRYVDGGILSNLPTFIFAKETAQSARRILAFSLTAEPRPQISSPHVLVESIVHTIIDGAQIIQERMFDVSKIVINTGTLQATDFDKIDAAVNEDLMSRGTLAAEKFFDGERVHAKRGSSRVNEIAGKDELLAAIVERIDEGVDDVCVVETNTDWIWTIFPTLARLRIRGVPIRVIVPDNPSDRARTQRALLKQIGGDIRVFRNDTSPSFRGYFFDGPTPHATTAIVGRTEPLRDGESEAISYAGLADMPATAALYSAAQSILDANEPSTPPTTGTLKTIRGNQEELFGRLRGVSQYREATLSMEEVPIDKLVSLTPYVHEFKFRQVPWILKFYDDAGVEVFAPADFVLNNNRRSMITPPVVEAIGDSYYLIEGTTRATWFLKQGRASILCVVARNVKAPLPASEAVRLARVSIVYKTVRDLNRYGSSFDYKLFRRIEGAVHTLDDVSE